MLNLQCKCANEFFHSLNFEIPGSLTFDFPKFQRKFSRNFSNDIWHIKKQLRNGYNSHQNPNTKFTEIFLKQVGILNDIY